jgi:acetolactate synthase-1/2/3 large subunit
MAKSTKNSVGRRGFLKGAAAGAAAFAATPELSSAQEAGSAPRGASAPSGAQVAREAGAVRPAPTPVIEHPGSDFMVDVLKSLNLEYLAANPGSTFESLHESIINYGNNQNPEFLTCTHEENAVAMCHGYAKIEGRPMMALIHGDIGLQHASMAIYNAYVDRVPVYMIVGNHVDGAERASGVQSMHSGNDLGALVRDYTKWDDQPYSLGAFAESAVRAYKIATTPPRGPVLLVAHNEVQSHPMAGPAPRIPKLIATAPPAGDAAAVAEAAHMLVGAERPLILAQRAVHSEEGLKLMVELAETLQAPFNSQERMNFPSHHPLSGNGGPGYQPDVVLGLEVADLSGEARNAHARGAKVIGISAMGLDLKSNLQEFGHYAEVDLDIGADAEATLPYLIEACKKLITADRRRVMQERSAMLAEAHRKIRQQNIEAASYGWDASPVSLARIAGELWPLVKNEDWSFVSPQAFAGNWPNRLWKLDKYYQYIGGQGAGGMGYGAPASVGAALANRKYGRLSINIQTDGDLNYSPGVLWTAAHHRIPLLSIMHNNRGYHQEVMFIEQMCSVHNRGADRAHIGTKLWDPDINYTMMAKAYGLYAEGPISDPRDLRPAMQRAIAQVKKGEPALIDVITQPR